MINATFGTVILDLDETLIYEKDGRIRVREAALSPALTQAQEKGAKLFIVSGIDPPPLGIARQTWFEDERARKLAQLATAGVDTNAFVELLVAAPCEEVMRNAQNLPRESIIADYARAKQERMARILQEHPAPACAIGDREDIEGIAAQNLGIYFFKVPAACVAMESDTIEWLLRRHVLGQQFDIPRERSCLNDQDVERIIQDPRMASTYTAFQREFSQYVQSRMWGTLRQLGIPNPPDFEAPNFNQYPGNLGSAWQAAETLCNQYDTVVGVARKGLWLSFVFHLAGHPNVKEIYLARAGNYRLYAPISALYRKDIEGKRVLLLDNDSLTGRSLQVLAEQFGKANPRYLDTLLVYKHCEPPDVKPNDIATLGFIDAPRVLGQRPNGTPVLDSLPLLRQTRLRNAMALDSHFGNKTDDGALRAIGKKLRVVG